MPTQPARTCPTYDYWHDLKTDLRKPESWLGFANMILRRFRLILVKNVKDSETILWRLRSWLTFLDEIHAQGKCRRCQPDPGQLNEILEAVIEWHISDRRQALYDRLRRRWLRWLAEGRPHIEYEGFHCGLCGSWMSLPFSIPTYASCGEWWDTWGICDRCKSVD